MPEREFELYLSLLSRFLRLQPAQRDGIADELRDHLDQRLEELAARGLSREEAIHKALGEFGDAAELAKHFTQAAHVRRRRLFMRCTYGTIAALAASLFIATAFWPSTPQAVIPSRSVAQEGKRPVKVERVVASFPPQSRVEQKLAQRIENVSIRGKKLSEVCRQLEDQLHIDFRFDTAALEEVGESPDSPVPELVLRYTALEARTILSLILQPLHLGYVIRDDLVTITKAENAPGEGDWVLLKVYNVRDLIPSPGSDVAAEAAHVAAGSSSFPEEHPATSKIPDPGTTPGAMLTDKRSALAYLIMGFVEPDQWYEQGGPCSITESAQYPGLLFVLATPDVHQKVVMFLDETQTALRDALAARNAGADALPTASR